MNRPQVTPTDDWQQLQLLTKTPEQRTYELIRPVVLFGQSASVRARATGVPQRTLYRQTDAFDRLGMASLAPPPQRERHLRLPAAIRQPIIDLKGEYPDLNTHEITTICWARFGQRSSPHTVKRILAEAAPITAPARRFPPYHVFTDPIEARLAIIRLHIEGWNATACETSTTNARLASSGNHTAWSLLTLVRGAIPENRAPHQASAALASEHHVGQTILREPGVVEGEDRRRAPLVDTALEGPQLHVGEAPGILRLQLAEEPLGGAGRVGRQPLLHHAPDLGERVGAGAPPARPLVLPRLPVPPPGPRDPERRGGLRGAARGALERHRWPGRQGEVRPARVDRGEEGGVSPERVEQRLQLPPQAHRIQGLEDGGQARGTRRVRDAAGQQGLPGRLGAVVAAVERAAVAPLLPQFHRRAGRS